MKFEPVTKLDQKNKKTAKQFGGDVMSQIVTSLLFFQSMVNWSNSVAGFRMDNLLNLTFHEK